ncbi:conserved hypothetical protein [Theileria orientalis strain Shintoku]|uniref:Uncharacterized protein n=1 Tax=Theileria orientalis strain Shintoku TaxID=869250 RepID=J4CC86_THEOR|nr:conserved hypothetical protein [Theileria orientalis strain Shintoku]BAM38957.1 conserved hypothetical protein [Theileria orientalis strain Shintoku]|eukprot:XP_009689258.1 conserved hypothetical protein [Theileria orientalis strain Shintoku]
MTETKKPEAQSTGKAKAGNKGPNNGVAKATQASSGINNGVTGKEGLIGNNGLKGNDGVNDKKGSEEISIKTQIQACPFNISPFSVLLVYSIIIFLTSSLYYNWPVFERILVDDMVFSELCTQREVSAAVPGVVVCDEQRDAIGQLALYIFYSEFLTYSVAGPLTDYLGLYPVMISGYMFGFMAFLSIFFFHSSRAWLKMSFAFWGVFGGAIFITSVHLGRLFPEATSLADGMVIFFDNMCAILPVLMHRAMRRFRLRFYEVLGSYLLWGIVPSFMLTLLFVPLKIHSRTDKGFSELGAKLSNSRLWLNLIVFSIPVNCSVYYRKMFSSYFHYNQRLLDLFPLILLFVFVPTPIISFFNQFAGIHITSSVIYVFHIISFFCFTSTSEIYGIVSIVLFAIVSSSSEQQTISYISEHHTDNECTLMGISYGVGFVVGTGLQYVLDRIYKRSPKQALYVIAALISVSIVYSVYCHLNPTEDEDAGDDSSFKILSIFLWFIPFVVLCVFITISAGFRERKWTMDEFRLRLKGLKDYSEQKNITIAVVLGSFSLYYVSNAFLVLISIFKFSESLGFKSERTACIIFYVLFFILPHLVWAFYVKRSPDYVNITVFVVFLAIFKVCLLYLTYFVRRPTFMYAFAVLLFFYGLTFFIFINMLAYYNFKITYVERSHFLSLVHWGFVPTLYFVLRFFHNSVLRYKIAYLIVWSLVFFFCLVFSIVLYLYFPYEIDNFLDFRLAKLPSPAFLFFDPAVFFQKPLDSQFYTRIINSSLSIYGFAVLLNSNPNRYILSSLCVISIYNFFTTVFDLQACCCNPSDASCSSCGCCCTKSANFGCAVCEKTVIHSKDAKCCNETGKCSGCVCKCLKRLDLSDYTIAFYKGNFKQVDENYFSFFIGTITGWILFLIYLLISKINITFYQC